MKEKYLQLVCGVNTPQGFVDREVLRFPVAEGVIVFGDMKWEVVFISPNDVQISVTSYFGVTLTATLNTTRLGHTGWVSLDRLSGEVYCLGIVEK